MLIFVFNINEFVSFLLHVLKENDNILFDKNSHNKKKKKKKKKKGGLHKRVNFFLSFNWLFLLDTIDGF